MTDDAHDIAPLRRSDLSGDQVPDDVRAAIGELANRWAYVEYQLKVVIRVSLKLTRPVQNLLLQRRDLRGLCELVEQIALAGDLWIPDVALRDEVKKLAADIARASSGRNDYVHGVFAEPRKGAHTGRFSRLLYQRLEHKLNPDWQPTSAKDIAPLIKKAQQLGVRTQNVTVKLKSLKH